MQRVLDQKCKHIIAFGDDTALSYGEENENALYDSIQSDLNKLSSERVDCPYCKISYAKRAVKKHIFRTHGVNLVEGKMLCLDCGKKFTHRIKLIKHLQNEHGKAIEMDVLQFDSYEDFEEWLKEEEKSSISLYTRHWGEKKMKNGSTITLICCRDGQANIVKDRKRSMKSQCSRKTGTTCTSHLVVYKIVFPDRKVIVKYFKTHYGHEKEVQHLAIPKQDKENIVNQLVLGVSPDNIICNAIASAENGTPSRMDYLNKKDIANIRKQFGIGISGGKRDNNEELINVDLWITKELEKEDPCVRYYKKFGEEDERCGFKKEDFCLVIITPEQIEALKKYGENVICVESSYGLVCNDDTIQLTTVLVVDEYGEGFPVSIMYSNKTDHFVYERMYLCLKDVCGSEVKCNYFMSDMSDALYSSWKEVMGEAGCRLISSWHILQDWNTSCYKIKGSNEEDRKQNIKMVRAKLRSLLFEQDLDTFEREYLEFEKILVKPNFKVFLKHWEITYSPKISEWAYCFRQNFPVTNNVHLESMHKTIRYFHFDRLEFRCLEKSITGLLDYLQRCFANKERFLLNLRPWNNVTGSILQAHQKSLLPGLEVLENINDDFLVRNEKSGGIYLVRLLKKEICCDTSTQCVDCNICCHTFSCSCKHYFLNEIAICRHIHFVATTACKVERCLLVDTDSVNEIPVDTVSVNEIPVDTVYINEIPIDTVSVNEIPVDTVSVNEIPVGIVSVNEIVDSNEILDSEVTLEENSNSTREEQFVELANSLKESANKFKSLPESDQMQILEILSRANIILTNSDPNNQDIANSTQSCLEEKRKVPIEENLPDSIQQIVQDKEKNIAEVNFNGVEIVFNTDVEFYECETWTDCSVDHEETVQ